MKIKSAIPCFPGHPVVGDTQSLTIVNKIEHKATKGGNLNKGNDTKFHLVQETYLKYRDTIKCFCGTRSFHLEIRKIMRYMKLFSGKQVVNKLIAQ